jgi:precorrin-8X/cobalt-precorrin-8 methylmutase
VFDRIVIVDWSASATPKRGADSIWVCVLDTRSGAEVARNPPTRWQARDLVLDAARAPGRTLIGVDFPLGYPAGLAAAVGLGAPPWAAVWTHLATSITDDALNHNNRWDVARDWNRRLGAPHFWGAPHARADEWLTVRMPRTGLTLPPYRSCEARLRARGLRPFTVWQLLGAGSVGSQALTGIPVMHQLRRHPDLEHRTRVWPFETGLTPLPATTIDDAVVIAEVWPSAIDFRHVDHPVKDAQQVIALARHFAAHDAAGTLGGLFAPTVDDADTVVREEGWVLGLT